MRSSLAIFCTLCAIAILLLSCKTRKIPVTSEESVLLNNYSGLPKNAIFYGKMNNGNSLYLIRQNENSTKMEGFCFVDKGLAIAELLLFSADSTGKTTFFYDNNHYLGKMVVNPKEKELQLTFPEIQSLKIDTQTIGLIYRDTIPEEVHCLEFFKDFVFDDTKVSTNIEYGKAIGYYTSRRFDPASEDGKMAKDAATIIYERWKGRLGFGDMKKEMRSLKMDIYSPKNNKNNKLPLFLFVHGGAFLFGDKKNDLQQAITNHLVRKGFVVASINYRMGSLLSTGEAINETFHLNVQDTRAALRFLINNKEVKIDENQIYLAGSSAGGIIALTTTFTDNSEVSASVKKKLGGLDDSGNDLKADIKIAGVVSMWGAVTDLKIVNSPIPTLLFHGTEDKMVPCGRGMPFQNFLENIDKKTKELFNIKITDITSEIFSLYGSCSIYEHSKKQKYPVKYVPFVGYGHDVHFNRENGSFNNENATIICNEIGDFMFENVSKYYFNYTLTGIENIEKQGIAPVYFLRGEVKNALVQWHVEGGFITDKTNDSIRVIWFDTYETGTVTACITNENGISCKKTLTIAIK